MRTLWTPLSRSVSISIRIEFYKILIDFFLYLMLCLAMTVRYIFKLRACGYNLAVIAQSSPALCISIFTLLTRDYQGDYSPACIHSLSPLSSVCAGFTFRKKKQCANKDLAFRNINNHLLIFYSVSIFSAI